jgi:L-alanine-DL-glutamate epimerase-like enolase superfamily enzyme
MRLLYKPYLLEFKHPFGVSSNTRTHTPTVFVRLEHEGIFGYGEACLPEYLGETTEDTVRFLEKARKVLEEPQSPFQTARLLKKIDTLSEKNNAGKAAIDIALHDLTCKMMDEPFCDVMGFGKSAPAVTSATIGIGDEAKIIEKIKEAEQFKILKIKAGTKDDKALINLIRKHTDKPLYVDVNQGWTDKFFVLDMLHWFKEKSVLLVEQPMPTGHLNDMAWVNESSPLPVIADESVKRLEDIRMISGCFAGINIKLMKCTGLTEAGKMIRFAKKHKLKVMLGCMAESSCATSAMAQYMQFADFVDLDAPNLIKNDPFSGINYNNGKVELNDLPGIGVELVNKDLFT